MKPKFPDGQLESGRPPGQAQGLLYNRPSETLIAVLVGDEPPAHRLYYRRLPATVYQPIKVRDKLENQMDAHSCDQAPFLIFNELRFRKQEPVDRPAYLEAILKGKEPPPRHWGADWLGIRRFNLETGEDSLVVDEQSLRPPPPLSSGWVSQILSVSADGSSAVCVVGLSNHYFVYELSFTDGLQRMIAKLPHVFL